MKNHSVFIITIVLLVFFPSCMSINNVYSESGEAGQTDAMQDDMNITEDAMKIGTSIYTIKENFDGNFLLDQYSCVVLEAPEAYYIACIDNGTVRAFVKFSKELELLEANGINPIDALDLEAWIGKEELAFISQYGPCHFDFGSGLYIPSYISKTGMIYFLYVDNGMISYISTFSPKDNRTITLE